MKRVLFVCTGNTCRSPMAQALFLNMVADRGDFQVGSAGVSAADGASVSRGTLDALAEIGLELPSFRSRWASKDIVEEATHIFALTASHLAALERAHPESGGKLYLLSEFSPDDRLRDTDVPDPFGGSASEYRATRERLLALLPSVLAFLTSSAATR